MFYTAVLNLGTDDQIKEWMPLVKANKITGCYA